MAKKKKKLVDDFDQIIESGDLDAFKAVFDKCEITATKYGGKDRCNALYHKNLTPEHIQFLVDNGLDPNSDCGFGYPAIAYHADNKDNLNCLLKNGAEINCIVFGYRGTALERACESQNPVAVKNLLEAGASVDVQPGFMGETLLETTLNHCDNFYIPRALEISKMLLASGCEKSEKTNAYVKKIGERFEFYRDGINKEIVDDLSRALDELYVLFDVTPVPHKVKHDGISEIRVTGKTWKEQYNELWNLLVPANGKAFTVQGEMIRIVGKVTYEILDNGGMNWDDEYRKMLKQLADFLNSKDAFGKEKTQEATTIISLISTNTDKKALYRLTELIVEWIVGNPKPIPLGDVDYVR